MVENDIWLGSASKQNASVLETFAPKKAPMLPMLMSRIGPDSNFVVFYN